MLNDKIADLRKEYKMKILVEEEIQSNPFDQFRLWWQEAINSGVDEINAMTLATCGVDGKPSARIVLLKDITNEGFTFFTNYESRKGNQLANNASAALVFFWSVLERQIRIEGVVSKIEENTSNAYFKTRPLGSQIGAWASPQSKVIPNRSWLELQEQQTMKKFSQIEIPKPPYWGGYIVKPTLIEFWQGRPNRLHDRIQYTLQRNQLWKIERLAP